MLFVGKIYSIRIVADVPPRTHNMIIGVPPKLILDKKIPSTKMRDLKYLFLAKKTARKFVAS